ncbi:Ribosomal protein S7 domain [Pseudocohnilembus persalinus]|uniref:Ribosomal protein S7 domain n=1 Tax=Pseudocohnilembus persalinus TaxID=266149 RepID=A0A0V0R2A5_PSEPJ|nr:Ribosomal protein S7 domain [Pseudocohnilembus persalinus]|eukprot:KRX08400.1 Ribosomal protein S7 domain [Pseudocohnilembus persalinus]
MAEQQQEGTFERAPKLYGKWDYQEAKVNDNCFVDYIAVSSTKSQVYLPHTAGRQAFSLQQIFFSKLNQNKKKSKKFLTLKIQKFSFPVNFVSAPSEQIINYWNNSLDFLVQYQVKRFRKALCPIVERLVGSMQFHGRNTGKKAKAINIVKNTFEIIHLLTGENPLKVLSQAIQKGGPREDSTKIGTGGVARRQAVDVSPLRRVNVAIFYMTRGARDKAFKSVRGIAECLADEIINTYKGNAQASACLRKKDEIEKVAKTNR